MALGAVLLFGAVATAHAGTITTWSGLQPTGIAGTNLPIIANGTGMRDAYPMSAATAKLSIDGAFLPRSSFTATARTASSVYFYYNPKPALSDGPHTFRVEMSDTAGKVSFKEWGVVIAQPPTAAWLEPVANWVMYSGYPRITMRLNDNTIGTTMNVLGAVRTGSATGPVLMSFGGNGLAAGDHSFSLPGELPPGTYYLTATVTDAAGNARLLQGASALKFTTQAAPAMTVLPSNCLAAGCHVRTGHPAEGSDCSSCHVTIYHENENCGECHDAHTGPVTVTDMFGNCESCHNVSYPSVPRHTVDSVRPDHGASCGGCHYENLLDVHGVIPTGSSYAYQCGLCHDSTDADVVAAIIARDTDCDACHTEYHAGFDASHTAPTETCSGADCHASTALVDTHEPYVGPGGRYPQYADTCALCHSNEDPDRIPEGATAECASCHPDRVEPHGADPAKHTAGGPCVASGCHDANVAVLHATPDCAACHAVGKTPSLVCSDCHTGDLHPDADHTSSVTCDACHSITNIVTIHGDDCATCHAEPVGSMGAGTRRASSPAATRHRCTPTRSSGGTTITTTVRTAGRAMILTQGSPTASTVTASSTTASLPPPRRMSRRRTRVLP